MSMHLRGSRDMMGQNEEGWWKSRTGMEQKLLILSTVLFIVAFSLTIALIVAKKQGASCHCECSTTTLAPTSGTGETDLSPETSSSEAPTSSAEPTISPSPTESTASPTESTASLTESTASLTESTASPTETTAITTEPTIEKKQEANKGPLLPKYLTGITGA